MNKIKTRVVSEVDEDEIGTIINFHVMADVEVSKEVKNLIRTKAKENEHLLRPFQNIVSEILNTEGSPRG